MSICTFFIFFRYIVSVGWDRRVNVFSVSLKSQFVGKRSLIMERRMRQATTIIIVLFLTFHGLRYLTSPGELNCYIEAFQVPGELEKSFRFWWVMK